MGARLFATAALFSLLLLGCTQGPKYTTVIFPDTFHIKAEVANDSSSRARGLMYRESLCPECGMLFIFENPQKYPFWMRNTRIPLDMIFINENGTVVDIIENAAPCPDSAPVCPNYEPDAPAKFVLEVNAGVAKENRLKIGDELLSQ